MDQEVDQVPVPVQLTQLALLVLRAVDLEADQAVDLLALLEELAVAFLAANQLLHQVAVALQEVEAERAAEVVELQRQPRSPQKPRLLVQHL